MLHDVIVKAQEIMHSMSLVEWAVAAALAVILVVAIVQQLAKTAVVIVLLMAVGVFLLHGHTEHWSF